MNVKQDNFKRIAENRVNKIIDMISKLENLNNTSFYEYSDEQMENVFNAIQKELDKQKELFKKNLNTDFKDFTVYFDSDYIILAEADKKLYLYNRY